MFNEVFGEVEEKGYEINLRNAVRAVIFIEDKLLMIKTNRGDIKFPGGGVELEESNEETLRREVREEAGYVVDKIIKKVGTVTERHMDKYEKGKMFKMISTYYLCTVEEKKVSQCLDEYEKQLEFEAVIIDIEKAIESNRRVIEKVGKEGWVFREWAVLNRLKMNIL